MHCLMPWNKEGRITAIRQLEELLEAREEACLLGQALTLNLYATRVDRINQNGKTPCWIRSTQL
jgi:hypothetical protein